MKDYREYREGVKNAALSIVQAVREEDVEPHDAIHAEVDANQWVIYTHMALAVLVHTRNDDAIFDVTDLSDCTSMSAVYSKAAYYAFAQDIVEELASMGFEVSDKDTFIL